MAVMPYFTTNLNICFSSIALSAFSFVLKKDTGMERSVSPELVVHQNNLMT